MGAFIVIVLSVAAGIIACMIYICSRSARFPFIQRLSGGSIRAGKWISFAIYLAAGIILYLTMNLVNTAIVILHFGGFLNGMEILKNYGVEF